MCLITFSEEVRFSEWNARDCEESTNYSSFKKIGAKESMAITNSLNIY